MAPRHRNLRGEARPVRHPGEGQDEARAQGTLADARRVRAELLLQVESERQTTSTNGSPAHSASYPSLADWLGGRYADSQARAQNERTRRKVESPKRYLIASDLGPHGHEVSTVRRNDFYDSHGHKVGTLLGSDVHDDHGHEIGTLNDIKKAIDDVMGDASTAALWLFFAR